ncbi:transmembrane protein 98-like isoform X2 [Oncorhynchus nerka]|uniref:transmembrane protein 98-like isoform X2 n=1 Tax=Oncorhynchus nerka TaxID=8023 RepID=UPI0031B844D3
METVVIVAIGVLATIFLASFIALVVVCRHRYCHPHHLLHHFNSKPSVDLIGAMETQSEPSELELDDVVITNPHIEAILENEDWIEDASGLVSHCISILKVMSMCCTPSFSNSELVSHCISILKVMSMCCTPSFSNSGLVSHCISILKVMSMCCTPSFSNSGLVSHCISILKVMSMCCTPSFSNSGLVSHCISILKVMSMCCTPSFSNSGLVSHCISILKVMSMCCTPSFSNSGLVSHCISILKVMSMCCTPSFSNSGLVSHCISILKVMSMCCTPSFSNSGLVSHCISILKVMSMCCTPCTNTSFSLRSNSMIFTHSLHWQICHTLTEKLVAMTMGSGAKVKAPASLSDIITVAKRISPRVDDVVRSMYPPLDPILLDARATALLLSVSHLVLVTRNACHMSGSMDWIDQSLHAAEDHMVVLREAALASEPERSLPGIDVQREQAI